jgi:hypothetical protein
LFVESLVLSKLGLLNAATDRELRELEPSLRPVLRQEGAWREMISESLGLDERFDSYVLSQWEAYRRVSDEHGVAPDAAGFASAVATTVLDR